MAEILERPIPEEFRDIAKALGLGRDATMAEFGDHLRVHTYKADPAALADFLGHFKGWDIAWECDDLFGHGERIGTVRVAGKKTPVFAHMGMTDLFDRTDPPLEKLFAKASKGRKSALVLQILPRFFIDAEKSGAMRGVLVQGGWVFSGDVWSPFVLTQSGPDDALTQRAVLKPGAPSRGLLCERGQDPAILKAVRAFQSSLVSRAEEPAGTEGGRAANVLAGDDVTQRIATGPTGWSFFGNEKAFEAHKRLMGSLNVPMGTPEEPVRENQVEDDIDRNVAADLLGHLEDNPDADHEMPDLAAALERAPAGLLEAVARNTETDEAGGSMLMHLAVLTNGFEGLDDASCEDVSDEELYDLIQCSTAAFSAGQLAYWLHEGFGWDFEWVSGTDPDDQEDDDGQGGEEGAAPDLVRHGDVFALLAGKDGESPVPVMFHGGRIDPEDAAQDFAFMATRRAAVKRAGGRPILVMPAAINMRVPKGEPSIEEGGGLDGLVMIAGYFFDGSNWAPVSFGQQGSDPMGNTLVGDDLLPGDENGYTGSVPLPHEDCGEMSDGPALRVALLMQQTLDRYHDLGPDVDVPRHFEDVDEAYSLMTQGGTWCWFQDRMQEEVFGQT